ncbi:Excalibur calcium-binding domain-containing protein [Cribrihabitans marinus]|uniref:Excalibur calcium-binding domain-containing protein n=2 Tax=Cribrihabitans marinus TaxID=1227549 RepID=A0A1H7CQJ8_9RHOB|nr:Excalibur calcium-binding domain-containing protein [Cribrihabitans marinus]
MTRIVKPPRPGARTTPAERRRRRAERTRARALSPVRLVWLLFSLPLIAGSVAVSVYLRTSPYPRAQAMQHLVARAGCEAAARVGVRYARKGQPGYHARNDPDGDGVACGSAPAARTAASAAPEPPSGPATRQVGGAKFVRP